MSISRNPRVLVSSALDLLSRGLHDLVDEALTRAYKTPDWDQRWAAEETKKRGYRFKCSKQDVNIQLRALTTRRLLFRDSLEEADIAHAAELRAVRNRWAHQQPISMDDALRTLDTAERLLRGVGATTLADEARDIRLAATAPEETHVSPAPTDMDVQIEIPAGSPRWQPPTGPDHQQPVAPVQPQPLEVPVGPVVGVPRDGAQPDRTEFARAQLAAAPSPTAVPPGAAGPEPVDSSSREPLAPHLPEPSFQFSLATGYELGDVDGFVGLLMRARCGRPELLELRDRVSTVLFHRVRRSGYLPSDVDAYIQEVLAVIDRRLDA